MDGSRREGMGDGMLIARATLAGAALGVLAMVGGGVFLRDADGLLAAAAGVVVTTVAALAVGLWAGSPEATPSEPRARLRWFGAGLTTGAAGVIATLLDLVPPGASSVLVQTVALLLMVAAPVYALGLLIPSLAAVAERMHPAWLAESDDEARDPTGLVVIPVLLGIAIGVALAAVVLIPNLGAGPVLFGTGAALILPTLTGDPAPAETDEHTVYESDTPYGSIRVVELVYPGERQPERRLFVNDEEESGELVRSGAPTLPYIAAAESWLRSTAAPADRYLFLGGGAYTLPRRVAEHDPRARITVVELDPEVTRVAYRYFGMRKGHGIGSIHGDARAFLDRAAPSSFERIYVDVYGGHEALPHSVVTAEAFDRLAETLTPDGMLTMNVIGVAAGEGAPRLWSVVRTAAEVFPAVALYVHLGRDYPDRQNFLLAASRSSDFGFPRSAGMFEPWPREEWPDEPTSTVFRDILTRAEAAAQRRNLAGKGAPTEG
jgi:hypothetical protein